MRNIRPNRIPQRLGGGWVRLVQWRLQSLEIEVKHFMNDLAVTAVAGLTLTVLRTEAVHRPLPVMCALLHRICDC